MGLNKVVVLIDMDGVLCDFEAGFLEKFVKKYPNKPSIPLNERKTFYIEQQYKTMFGVSVDACSIIEEEKFFLDLPPIEGAIEGFNALISREDVEYFICTSPLRHFDNCVSEKYRWVANHLGYKTTEKIVLTRDKTILNAHFLIDDKPKINGMQKPCWRHILFETHHNRHVLTRDDQTKLCGWKDSKTLHDMISEKFEEINSSNSV